MSSSPREESFVTKGFSGIVPVFPLPNVVLFPGMFLPLHIFEPRYRQMTRDALKGERLLAMALLKPGWQTDTAGAPPIHQVLGMGKIVEDAELDDGRFNLVLFGLVRVRILHEIGSGPYRRARVELLGEPESDLKAFERKRRTLIAIYVQIMKDLTQGAVAAPPDDVPLGMLCDLVASLFKLEAAVRQELLEELEAAKRCDRLLELLQGTAPGVPAAEQPPRRGWPPGPSLN
jgi:Lon protease-like protein